MPGGYYWDPGCVLTILPEEKPGGMDQKYWEARKKVKIKRDKLFKWMNGLWAGRRTMSGFYRRKTPCDEPKDCPCKPPWPCADGICDCGECNGCICCQRSEETTQSNIQHLFDQAGPYFDPSGGASRENKCPKLKDPYFPEGNAGYPGTYIEGKCNGFNRWPIVYGRIPDSDLIKTFYNACRDNHSTAWHETTYQRRNIGPVERYCDDEAPDTDWIQYNDNTTDRVLQASTCGSIDCGSGRASIRCYYGNCRVRFFSVTSIHIPKTGHWYDPEKDDVYPDIVFSSTYPTVGWQTQYMTQGSGEGAYQKHSTKVTITVDGVTIPSGSSWGRPYYAGALAVTDTWTLKERDK